MWIYPGSEYSRVLIYQGSEYAGVTQSMPEYFLGMPFTLFN